MQYRLKTLMLLVMLAAVPLIYFNWNRQHYAAIAELRRHRTTITWARPIPNWLDQFLGDYRFDEIELLRLDEPFTPDAFEAIARLRYLGGFHADPTGGACDCDFDQLVPHAATLKEFTSPNLPDNYLQWLPKFRALQVFSCGHPELDLSLLSGCKNMKVLYLVGCKTGFETLSKFRQLEYLHANGTELQSLEPLVHCPKLEHLTFTGCQVSDVRPLFNLKNLKYVEFEDTLVGEENYNELKRRHPVAQIHGW